MKVYYIAAFAEPANRAWFSLGRKRKVDQVISLLSGLGYEITTLNIAPSPTYRSPSSSVHLCSSSFVPLRYLQLALSSSRFFLSTTRRNSTAIIWLYNTRAAESIVAIVALLLRPRLRLVLQLEDLPSARLANHGLSGFVDRLTTLLLNKRANHVFAVSKSVASSFSKLIDHPRPRVALLPPSLDPIFVRKALNRSEPFDKRPFVILYAGSYQLEKGVTDLIESFLRLEQGLFRLLLVGSAPIDFVANYSDHSDIKFTGVVEMDALFEYYTSADVVVNPHRPILNSGNVFPFKLVETVASGALPLTTPVPGSEIFGLPSDCFFTGVDDLPAKLSQARLIWQRNRETLRRITAACLARYSVQAIQSQVGIELAEV